MHAVRSRAVCASHGWVKRPAIPVRATASRIPESMEDVPLIPLKVLLGNPTYASAKVSPDGGYISYLKPSVDTDVLNVWIRPRTAAAAAAAGDIMVTSDSHRGIRLYTWSQDSKHILYLQDVVGDEDWHLFAQAMDKSVPRDLIFEDRQASTFIFLSQISDVGGDEDWHLFAQAMDKSTARELTPGKGVRAENLITDPNFPNTVLVGLNKRDPRCFDMYRVDLRTGDVSLDTQNPGDVISWYADAELNIRGAVSLSPADGSKTLRVRETQTSPWFDLIHWPQQEEGDVIGFSKGGKSIYVTSSLGTDTTQLQEISATPPTNSSSSSTGGSSSGSSAVQVLQTLAGSAKCDVGRVLVAELEKVPQAVGFDYLRNEWKVLDSSLQVDFDVLSKFKGADADLAVESRSTDNTVWLVSYTRDNAPVEYYIYDRSSPVPGNTKLDFLFVNRPELIKYKLGRRHTVVLKARDGVKLPSYLTLPPLATLPKGLLPQQYDPQNPAWRALSGSNLPLVLFVHGGPWARDVWGLDVVAQWFANRGYAVLQVNYRASTGYGKHFQHLGDNQWGVGTMQHDLTDVVNWAIQSGIADPKRIAIYGGSYGGYACLAGLAFTPELYCCGVDIVGPSHIRTLLQSIPAYWAPMKQWLVSRVGDVEVDDDMNQRISPFYHASSITSPLIIAQGANDPRVKKAESDQIYTALQDKGVEVEYYLYTDEGHGFARPPNRLDFCSKVDHFLAKHLQGRAEPPSQLKGTSVVAMHQLESLDDLGGVVDHGQGKTAAAAVGAGVAAAAVGAGVVVAGKKGGFGGLINNKVGLAVGVPVAVVAGAAALVVAVLRGLSPRK